MKMYTAHYVRDLHPCTDPDPYLPDEWQGTVVDVLRADQVPPMYRIWFAVQPEVLNPQMARLFAVWCARQALGMIENPDSISVMACNVAEKYAKGESPQNALATAFLSARAVCESMRISLGNSYAANAAYLTCLGDRYVDMAARGSSMYAVHTALAVEYKTANVRSLGTHRLIYSQGYTDQVKKLLSMLEGE
jgi:hypothetical protein